jgi:hypothetical protein
MRYCPNSSLEYEQQLILLEVQIDYWKPGSSDTRSFTAAQNAGAISILDAMKVNKRWREVRTECRNARL